ncbi:GntR family transcriptional regulator [Shewanella avicenniae]|uniref:GntR family transcriptional regulator n=1 Tax=Shewanella avicenniae TaxID=2814294 RepID=A0ABX7QKU9_9GAMM|nr:S1-like domain-containing RNA-binding protein [Shewanella avicenniae]QSX32082.1 GntR family transcriptional regulator [Shewanella avicenniae]
MVELGKTCHLPVVKHVEFGVYLNADAFGQVLLPRKYVPEQCEIGDEIEVFIYLDSEDTPIATTRKPLAQVGEFAYLKTVATGRYGAFLDWGLDKDLLLPFSEQRQQAEEGRSYLVYVHVNRADERIVASAKIDKFIDKTPANYRNGEQVNIIVAGKSDLGQKVIVNQQHWGVIHQSDLFRNVRYGQALTAFIKQVRADGKLDIVLQKHDREALDAQSQQILKRLNQAAGFLPFSDKTSPEVIYAELGMSKKAFKKAIGGLYKAGKIEISDEGIRTAE